jgi:hypothetical protein
MCTCGTPMDLEHVHSREAPAERPAEVRADAGQGM